MVLKFEIIQINIHHIRGLFIFPRHLGGSHDLTVVDGAILRDLPICHYRNIQPKDENGKALNDIFVFRPLNIDRLFDKSFKEGDIVELTLPD